MCTSESVVSESEGMQPCPDTEEDWILPGEISLFPGLRDALEEMAAS